MPHSQSWLRDNLPLLGTLTGLVAVPEFAFGQDQTGGTALTPVAWALTALLAVCAATLAVLALRWRTAKTDRDRSTKPDS